MKNINSLIVFSIFYILGIIGFFTDTVLGLAFFALIILILSLFKNYITLKSAALFYIAFSLALVNCNFQIKNYDELSSYIPAKGTIVGIVETIPTTNNSQKTKFYLKVKSINLEDANGLRKYSQNNLKARTIVTIYDVPENYQKIKIADTVELKGKLRSPMKAKNPSQFDYSKYLKNHKTFSTFYVNDTDWRVVSAPTTISGKFLQSLNDKRLDILAIHSKYIKSPNLEVLGGIVFGDDAINPPDEIKNSFINSGLLHILAASGMNVSIIFGLWFFIGTRFKLNYRFIIFTGAILVAFYTLMTGMGPSVLRAALMIEFVLLGKLIDRSANSIALVFFVALLMLLYNPAMINDIGFQLSFVVTFALMFYCPPLLEKIDNKIIGFLVGAVLIPFVAQLFAAPIQMFYFNTFATYSILANFAITPFIMVISFIGFLSSIVAMIPFCEKICFVFDIVLNPFVTILVKISDYFSQLPKSLLITVHPSICKLILYYAFLLILGLCIRYLFKNKKQLICLLIVFLLFCCSFFKFPNSNCEILIFDVGNADSFLIKSPKNKYIMIDTARGRYKGSSASFSQADAIMGKYLRDNGIKGLELLILTHFDVDHSGGTIDILKTVNVKKLVINKEKDNSITTRSILNYIKENKINCLELKNSQLLFEENNFKITAYAPNIKTPKNDNDNSIVTMLSYGDFDMLFMADGDVFTYENIKSQIENDKVEVLKSGHHGALNTVSKAMLDDISPDSAIISTGYNTYGHPASKTLRTLAENNVNVYRTDVNNAIKIVAKKRDYKILKYNSEKKRFEKIHNNPCNKL